MEFFAWIGNQWIMSKVSYRGKSYDAKMVVDGLQTRHYSLYNSDGILTHFVEEHELDKPSVLKSILKAYHQSIMEEQPPLFNLKHK
jgi:hypothetical protein